MEFDPINHAGSYTESVFHKHMRATHWIIVKWINPNYQF